jgi:hypothetical protein
VAVEPVLTTEKSVFFLTFSFYMGSILLFTISKSLLKLINYSGGSLNILMFVSYFSNPKSCLFSGTERKTTNPDKKHSLTIFYPELHLLTFKIIFNIVLWED